MTHPLALSLLQARRDYGTVILTIANPRGVATLARKDGATPMRPRRLAAPLAVLALTLLATLTAGCTYHADYHHGHGFHHHHHHGHHGHCR